MNLFNIITVSYVALILIVWIITKSIRRALKWASLVVLILTIVLGVIVYKDIQTIKSFSEKEIDMLIVENNQVITGSKIINQNQTTLTQEELQKEQQEMEKTDKEKIKIYFISSESQSKERTEEEKEALLQEKITEFTKNQQEGIVTLLNKIKTKEMIIKPRILSLEIAANMPQKIISRVVSKVQDIALKTSKTL